MLRILMIINLLTLKAFCESDLYKGNEEIKAILNDNVYEPNYFGMLFGLLMVICLVYLTAYVYQKLIGVKLPNVKDNPNKINILSSISLGQNKNLHVVEVNDKKILIGSTQNNITYLKELDVVGQGENNE